ncbi:RNA polymerase sigma factor [Luteolibacter sp. Populi]|uniref:RNA polymerase sigma factor n=1 Tax=Luteolibacter sp. Populi TaxID=3230487 RepID=UPI003466E749
MSPPAPHDDHQLLDRFLRGNDQGALALLVERYLPLVYTVALRVTRQPQLAEEAGQDVFLKLVQKPPALMKGIPLAAWLHRATRTRAIDLLRSERSRAAREQVPQELSADGPVLSEEALDLLDEVIDRLPESERRLVVGRFFLGQSFATLSAQAGATEDAVRMRLNRALEKMRQSFSRRGIATTAAILAQVLPAQAVAAPPRAMAAAVLKSVTAAGATTGASVSLTSFIYLMTTAQKYTIAGALLLAAAIPTALHISQRPDDPKESGVPETSSTPALPKVAQSENERAARTPRKELDGQFAALAAKYGEAEARRAQALASQGAALVHDIATTDKFMEQFEAQFGGEIDKLSTELELTPEQDEFIEGMRADAFAKRRKEIQDLAAQVPRNLPALAEVFLAVDALSRGKIDEETYKEVIRGQTAALSAGSIRAWNFFGMVGTRDVYKAEDPFAGQPEAAKIFAEHLDPERRKEYQEIHDTNAAYAAEIPNFERKDLDGLAGNVAGMGKMIEAMRLMDPEKLREGK